MATHTGPTDPWALYKKRASNLGVPDPGTDPAGQVPPGQSGGGPDGGPQQVPPADPAMSAWGKDFWKRMIETLGVTKSTIPGEGEFGYYKGQRVALDPGVMSKLGSGWDTSEVWNTGTPGNYKPRYAEGEVPDWMKTSLSRFTDMKAKGALSQDDLNKLADHWVRGVGIDPVWANAFAARPGYISTYLRDFFRGLGATSV